MTALMVSGLLVSCNSQNNVVVNGEKVELEDGIYAKLETTKGDILFKFETEKAPMTSANFIALAEGNMPGVKEEYKGKPYFDGLTFHRVIPGFMIQGGDPAGNGSGGPGYEFPNEIDKSLTHDKGVVSMANAGPGTNGSQFFITTGSPKQLDGSYSIFGKVVEGQSVAEEISNVPRSKSDKPNEDVVINKVTIIRKGKEAKKFDAPAVFENTQKEQAEAKAEKAKAEKAKIKEMAEGYEEYPSGLYMRVVEEGDGAVPETGQKVKVHYTGTLVDGTKFDSSRDRNQPFEFRVGVRQVIAGWDEAVQKMHVGEKVQVLLPPDLAYGQRGAGGVIPPNAWLKFDIELLEIVKEEEK